MSLDVALKSLRLFIVDYSILEKADVDSERAVSFDRLTSSCSNTGSIRDDPYWTSRKNC